MSSLRAVLRLLVTGVGIMREPSYIAVRTHIMLDDAACVSGDRAA